MAGGRRERVSTSCPLGLVLSSPRPTDPECNQESFSLDREEAEEAARKEGMGLALHCTAFWISCIVEEAALEKTVGA